MPSRWEPPVTWFEALLALGLLFGVIFVVTVTILFWLRAMRPIGRALVQTQIASHGGPVVVRDTPAIQAARHNAMRAAARAGHQF